MGLPNPHTHTHTDAHNTHTQTHTEREKERERDAVGSRVRERVGEASLHVVEMTQINIHNLNQTKINGRLSLQLSPSVTRRLLVGQNQH